MLRVRAALADPLRKRGGVPAALVFKLSAMATFAFSKDVAECLGTFMLVMSVGLVEVNAKTTPSLGAPRARAALADPLRKPCRLATRLWQR